MNLDPLRRRVARVVQPNSIYAAEQDGQGFRASLSDLADRAAMALGRTERSGRQLQFDYRGFRIPVDLAEITGAGAESWDEITRAHLDYYERWAPIAHDARVLEIGCGIGRDAIRLLDVISSEGSYVGIDIVEPSIHWCQKNISRRHPNFRFILIDVESDMYNPAGSARSSNVTLPVASDRFDRVVLHSVFTHMFFDDVARYLREFRRVLKPGGLVLTSFFIVDAAVLAAAGADGGKLTFEHQWDDRIWVEDREHPEGAIAYTHEALQELVEQSGLELLGLHPGFWNRLNPDAPNGQDIAILAKRAI